jgi:DNA-3-methyladenine glycosylase
MFGPKGHAYIYLIYGLYYCLNVTSGAILGKPEATLIRAIEPIEGMDLMMKRRGPNGQMENIASGPGRLCIAMGLSKLHNGIDVCQTPFCIEDNPTISSTDIVETTRIGVDYATDWKDKPWRFYIKSNPFVSVKLRKQ